MENQAYVSIKEKHIQHGARVQNPDKLKDEVEALGFKLEKLWSHKSYGILLFTKQN